MNQTDWNTIDPERGRLRSLVKRVRAEFDAIDPKSSPEPLRRLSASIEALVVSLDLGEEPETRTCPFCQRLVMRAATRCRYCMKKSAAEQEG